MHEPLDQVRRFESGEPIDDALRAAATATSELLQRCGPKARGDF